MAYYKATDTEFQSVANTIRTKGGTQAQLEWPTEFISAIQNLPYSPDIYTGTDDPSNSLGNDGDYYYKVENIVYSNALKSYSLAGGSSGNQQGNEYIIAQDCVITKIGATMYYNNTGSLIIGNLQGIIETIPNLSFSSHNMLYAPLTNPIQARAGEHYIIQAISDAYPPNIEYARTGEFYVNEVVASYYQVRYGGYPGSMVDINPIIVDFEVSSISPVNKATRFYYKNNGIWVEVQ